MHTSRKLGLLLAASTTLGLLSVRCGTEAPAPTIGTGGSTGGAATGGAATGGATGGAATGGAATGGAATGGAATGGASTGGASIAGGGAGGSAGSTGSATGGDAGGGGASPGGAAPGGTGGAQGGANGGQAGGGAGGSGGGGPVTFAQVEAILTLHCGGCHYGSGSPVKVNLRNADGMLYMRLTTPITSANAAKCNGRILVDKTTPANSLIRQAIQPGGVNDAANNCVIPQMPAEGVLTPMEIQTIMSWIDAGAPQ